jgi:hypothetical protein
MSALERHEGHSTTGTTPSRESRSRPSMSRRSTAAISPGIS